MNFRCFFTTLLAAPLLFVSAASQTEEAQQHLHSAMDEVLGIAGSAASRAALNERLRPVLEKHISFAVMTRRAVGPGWRQFTAQQQQKATQLFTTLVIRTYSNKFTIGEHPVVDYRPAVSPAAGRVDVPTNMIYQGNRYTVIYRMEQDEGWRMTDVVIEGVSMIANYRSQLDAEFKKGGAETVISSLSESVARQQ